MSTVLFPHAPRLIWRLPLSIPLRNQGDGREVSSAKRQSAYLSPPSQSDGSLFLRAAGSQWPADLFRDGPDCREPRSRPTD